MKADAVPLLQLLGGNKQFVVPVFQRDYSWELPECGQLWADVVRVGKSPTGSSHFVGSVVYVAPSEVDAMVPRWLLIDGQQRLTTLTLLLTALRDYLTHIQHKGSEDLPGFDAVQNLYLVNPYAPLDARSKLRLRRTDDEALQAVFGSKPIPNKDGTRIDDSYEFFAEQMPHADLPVLWRGLQRLVVVSVSLTRGYDDPQLIFESLNSTGMALAKADLVRNFVLMRLDEATQSHVYDEYWRPLEMAFGTRYRTDFDSFLRDYLTLELKPSKPLRLDDVYRDFQHFFAERGGAGSAEAILRELVRYGRYYARYAFGDADPDLEAVFQRLRGLIDVAPPLAMALFDAYDRQETLTKEAFIAAIELVESYVFRRNVCRLETRSLGSIVASVAQRLDRAAPLQSLRLILARQAKPRRFPDDSEFQLALQEHDVYEMRICKYLLTRLQNVGKEKVVTDSLTIEHVMPQNEQLGPEWRAMLGTEWKTIQEKWLHKLGNLTLTGYNTEYSDKPFAEKKTMTGGFASSPLWLNKEIASQPIWGEQQIRDRGSNLAAKCVGIWPSHKVPEQEIREAELRERVEASRQFSAANLELNDYTRPLFEAVCGVARAAAPHVLELFGATSVVYRLPDWFLEIVPRKRKLTLRLAAEPADLAAIAPNIRSASEWSFVINSTVEGGSLYVMSDVGELPVVHALIERAVTAISE